MQQSHGYRMVDFDIMADREVAVHAVSAGDETWLVGLGSGLLNIKFSTVERVGISVVGDPEAAVYIRTRLRSQVVAESGEPTYTTIEPRRTGQSDEVQRLMRLMHLNQQWREQKLRDEFEARFREHRGDQVIEPLPQEPEPASGPDEG